MGGFSLSHLLLWMTARQRNIWPLVIADGNGSISTFASATGGDRCDFGHVIAALPEQAPKGWDLIQLDKGRRGVKADLGPSKSIVISALDFAGSSYDVYRWTGEDE